MTWRNYALLFFLGLALAIGIASMQSLPGYLDSDYYYAGGLQLVEGKGFTEPYLWNYLDNPVGLPHSSHTYWLPLSSILAAASMFLTGLHTYAGARLIFILIAALVPLVTAALAFDITQRRDLALTSGLLAIFSIYHAPFMPVTDNFGPFMLLGGLFFLLMLRKGKYTPFILGLLVGLLNLARSDGLLWLGLAGLLTLWRSRENGEGFSARLGYMLRFGSLVILGYLLVMGPWYAHNLSVFGSPMAPGGSRILWLTNYNDTFAFPADKVNMQAWLAAGWGAAIQARLAALRMNLLNAFGAQAGIILLPFILLGLWYERKNLRTRVAVTGWLLLLTVMTIIFPFAGARGGFFHAGAAFQSFWWAMAPLGLERLIAAGRRRNLLSEQSFLVFRASLVGICVMLTGVIIWLRIIQPGWQPGEELYMKIERVMEEQGASKDEIVIVRNPVGYYIVSGRSAIVMPPGGVDVILELSQRYNADYLVLEPGGVMQEFQAIYEKFETNDEFAFVGEIDDACIYELHPSK